MLLMVGCGDLGSEIARLVTLAGHQVVGVRISNQALTANIQVIQADVANVESVSVLKNINPTIIIYCISAAGQTDAQYQAAYVQGLKNVLATQVNNTALQHVFFVSSTRVYGQKTDGILDENIPATPCDFGGERLLEAEHVLKTLPCKSTSMRLSGIYGKGRLYLANMAKDPARWPIENSWGNRIHRDDAAAFIAFLVEKVCNHQSIADCYIVTDDMPTQQYEVLTWLAKQQHVALENKPWPPVTGGKRLSNQRLRSTGFVLQYPNYQIGYGKVLQAT